MKRYLWPLKGWNKCIEGSRSGVRFLHRVPILGTDDQIAIDEILPVFGKDAFKMAWTEYQQSLLTSLNNQCKGTIHEDSSVLKIVLRTWKQLNQVAMYNFASQAYNNHFFFKTLVPASRQPQTPEPLKAAIEKQWGSVENLQDEFINTANSIFGNGWTWLVLDPDQKLRITTTYNAGNPFIWDRKENHDLLVITDKNLLKKKNFALLPILTVCCWQHCYLLQYGVSGKQNYLLDWWNCIDWTRVNEMLISAKDPLESYPLAEN